MELTEIEQYLIQQHFGGGYHPVVPEWYWYDVDRKLETDDGEIVVKVFRFSERGGGGFAWVVTPDGDLIPFVGKRLFYRRNRQRAHLFAELWARTGRVETSNDPSFIPLSVAAIGKPAIAAYLIAVHQLPHSRIARELDISESTVGQYLSHFQERQR